MLFKSQVYTQASGSIGGVTYSRNRGGMYTRGRAIPSNPGTPGQVIVRSNLASLAGQWAALTAAQRTAWAVYASLTPLLNKLGESLPINALAMFLRCNTARLRAGLAAVLDGPVTPGMPYTGELTGEVDQGAQELEITRQADIPWATEVGAYLLVQASRPQSPTINYFAGPYQYVGKTAGAGTPPTNPSVYDLTFPAEVGQVVFVQARVTDSEGRLSSPFRLSALSA